MGIPDWWFHRIFAAPALVGAGYCADEGWVFCAAAWFIVAGGLLLWSIEDKPS